MHLVVFLGTLMLSCSPFCRRAAAQRRWRKPPVCMASQLRRACKWSGQLRTGAPLLCTHCCSQLAAFCCRNWGPLDGASLHVPCAKKPKSAKKSTKKKAITQRGPRLRCAPVDSAQCRVTCLRCMLPSVRILCQCMCVRSVHAQSRSRVATLLATAFVAPAGRAWPT